MVEEIDADVYVEGDFLYLHFQKKLLVQIDIRTTNPCLMDLTELDKLGKQKREEINELIVYLERLTSNHDFFIDEYRVDAILAAMEENDEREYHSLLERIMEEERIIGY